MTSPEPMTREELVELAALDVFGLLDEYEAALYTRSFHHASVAVQDEIVELQASIAQDTRFLPDMTAPAELREQVLSAVSSAVEQANSELAPIASIGRRTPVSVTTEAKNGNPIFQFLFGGTGQVWRAACFVLSGALIVLTFFWVDANRHANKIADLALDGVISEQLLAQLGPSAIDYLLDPAFTPVAMSSVSDRSIDMQTSLRVGEDRVFVLYSGLPTGVYTLSMTDHNGQTETKEFRSSGTLGHAVIKVAALNLANAATWTLSDAQGPLLQSA